VAPVTKMVLLSRNWRILGNSIEEENDKQEERESSSEEAR